MRTIAHALGCVSGIDSSPSQTDSEALRRWWTELRTGALLDWTENEGSIDHDDDVY